MMAYLIKLWVRFWQKPRSCNVPQTGMTVKRLIQAIAEIHLQWSPGLWLASQSRTTAGITKRALSPFIGSL